MTPALLIKSLEPYGHFRAGRYHGLEEKAWAANCFTVEEIEQLRNDPRLNVTDGEIDAPENLKLVPKLAATPVQVRPVAASTESPSPAEADQATATAAAPEGETPSAPAKAKVKTSTKAKTAKA